MNSQQETEGLHLFSVSAKNYKKMIELVQFMNPPEYNAEADDRCPVCEMPYETSYRRWNEEMGCYICPDCQDQMEWESDE